MLPSNSIWKMEKKNTIFLFALFIWVMRTTYLTSPALVSYLVYPTQKHLINFLKEEADPQNMIS